MRVTLAGYLSDHKGRVLLQRPSARSLEPVTCPLKPGEEPATTLVSAFRAATGLIVLPIRLVGVYTARGDELTLTYRCTLRGGELATPAGQPAAGFFDTQPPPRGLNAAHARQLDDARHHDGGPARLALTAAGLAARLGRGPARESSASGVEWAATARLIAVAGDRVLWTRADAAGPWRLPARAVAAGDAPWQTAGALPRALGLGHAVNPSLRLIVMAASRPAADRPALSFVFLATYGENELTNGRGEHLLAAPAASQSQTNLDAGDAALAAEVLAAPAGTVARLSAAQP